MTPMPAFDLETTFLGLDGEGAVAELPTGPEFWASLASNPKARGYMMGVYPMTADWPSWERHPAGDEVLVLLEGRLELIVEQDGGERRIDFRPGMTFVVPSGAWHTARVLESGWLLGVTWGSGTDHRPVTA